MKTSIGRRRPRVIAMAWALSVAVPSAALTAPSAGADPPPGLPPGLQPTLVSVHPTLDRSLLGAQIAANPTNPNNIVIAIGADTGYTEACIAAGAPECELVETTFPGGGGLLRPAGHFDPTLGFDVRTVYVSFDRGRTWTKVDISHLRPAGRPHLYAFNEGWLDVAADGTFYLLYNALDWGTPDNFAPSSGVAVTKSTDGGLTWSEPVLTGTPADSPQMAVDQSTGTVYSVTGLGASTPLGPRSTGDPNSPILTPFGDVFIAASQDGVHWTQPQRAGGTDGVNQFSASGGKRVAAAYGKVAVTFTSTSASACAFFVGGAAPCTVFQTSRNAGATWTRHRAPFTGVASLVADPSTPGHYTIASLTNGGTQISVFQTRDSGRTWSGPTVVTEDPTKTHVFPGLDYSPKGDLGLVWRTNEPGPGPSFPYSIWAAISEDGGRTFSRPLQVNCCSPAAPNRQRLGGNIDPAFIALSDKGQGAYVAWGDWRTGERNPFFSAVKLQAFNHPRR